MSVVVRLWGRRGTQGGLPLLSVGPRIGVEMKAPMLTNLEVTA